eukprot:c5659_g1_i1.p1 GENE.c5659_g1_i1~~c5659_g1_i1.p1  ORF type:complete len:273 (-),score=72.91 c5659_g1_i1:306-1067(-)
MSTAHSASSPGFSPTTSHSILSPFVPSSPVGLPPASLQAPDVLTVNTSATQICDDSDSVPVTPTGKQVATIATTTSDTTNQSSKDPYINDIVDGLCRTRIRSRSTREANDDDDDDTSDSDLDSLVDDVFVDANGEEWVRTVLLQSDRQLLPLCVAAGCFSADKETSTTTTSNNMMIMTSSHETESIPRPYVCEHGFTRNFVQAWREGRVYLSRRKGKRLRFRYTAVAAAEPTATLAEAVNVMALPHHSQSFTT